MSDKTGVALEVSTLSVSDAVWKTGGGLSVVGFFSQINWMAVIGMVLAILGFVVSWYYQRSRDRRETLAKQEAREAQARREAREIAEHEVRMQALIKANQK